MSEFMSSFPLRSVDKKRRIKLPPEWLEDGVDQFVFFQDEYSRIYTLVAWKNIMKGLKTDKEKIKLAKKSTIMKLDDQHRLLLPKHCVWKKIDLTGVIDYIVICESAE